MYGTDLLMSSLLPVLPVLLVAAAAAAGWHGLRLLGRLRAGRDHKDAPLWLVRGGRALIVALSFLAVAAGLRFSEQGLVWFGLAFLGEEIYETGVVLLILRRHRAVTPTAAACR